MNPVPGPGWSVPAASQPFPGQQPQYGYPPAGPKPPVTRSVSAGLLVLTGVSAIVGSFLTLDTIATSGSTVASSNTGWTFTFLTGSNSTESVVQWLGVPLVIGGGVAIVAGVMLLLGGSRPLPLAGPMGIAGAGLTVGATLAALSTVLTDIGITNKQNTGTDRVSDHPGIAFYLLIVSAVCAVVVLVMMVRAVTRGATPAGTSTPFRGPAAGYPPPGYGIPPGYTVAPPPGFGHQSVPRQQPISYGQPPTYGPVYRQPSDEQQPSSEGRTTPIPPPSQQ